MKQTYDSFSNVNFINWLKKVDPGKFNIKNVGIPGLDGK